MMQPFGQDQDVQGTLFEDQALNGASSEAFVFGEPLSFPAEDNTPEGLQALLAINAEYRTRPWMPPFDATTHTLHLGDARDLSWIPDESVDLVVTSPPYWTLKQYQRDRVGQMGDIADYEEFLAELDQVWRECIRVLVGGGRICCVVGDVCIPRKKGGRHYIMPLHADIQVRARKLGLDCLTPIMWHKIANGTTEAEGNGAGFYGKPYQPGAIIKNDIEYILFLRKGGKYRSVNHMKKALSIAGDTVLDPFLGIGSTSLAALLAGRNSIGNEIEPAYIEIAYTRLTALSNKKRHAGAVRSSVCRIGF